MYLRRVLAWLAVAAASGAFGCESGNITRISVPPDAAVDLPHEPALTDASVSSTPEAGTAGSGGMGGTGGADAASDCQAKEQAFTALVAAHSDCSVDADCRVINCGDLADAYAIRLDTPGATVDAIDDAYFARCGQREPSNNNPLYRARCRDQRCVLGEQVSCCGCPPDDAGPDAN